jgi:hypothetical protein
MQPLVAGLAGPGHDQTVLIDRVRHISSTYSPMTPPISQLFNISCPDFITFICPLN